MNTGLYNHIVRWHISAYDIQYIDYVNMRINYVDVDMQ